MAGGYDVTLDLYPEGPDGPVVRATFAKGGNPDPLAAHIMNRRSAKEAFADTPVSGEKAEQLHQYCEVHIDQATVNRFKDITWLAQRLEMNIPRTLQESVKWMRFGKADINASPDGIVLGCPLLESMMLAVSLHPSSQAAQEYEEMKPHFNAAYDLLAQDGQTVQMLGRLGYVPNTLRAPRWALETKLRNG